jgi:O-antigen/teichoic acid export membrane protein
VLVRLLEPADFGLVAMATTVLAMLELFGQFGFDMALIQTPEIDSRHYNTAWTFNIIVGVVTALVLLMLAVPAARFFNEPRLVLLIYFLSLSPVIQSFENVGIVAFRKELRFDMDFKMAFKKKLAGFMVVVPLAIIFRNYWALIAGTIMGRLAGVFISYRIHSYRPKFSLEARGDLFKFSKWMMISNGLFLLNSRAADFILGKVAGAKSLGIFNISYEISNLPTSEMIAPINRAVYPGYALKATNHVDLKRGYLDVIGLVGAFGMPAAFGIAATADLLVPVFLGPKWLDAIPLVCILSMYGLLVSMKSNNHYVYLAMGKPKITTQLGAIQMLFLLPTLAICSIKWGVLGAASAYLASQLAFSPVNFTFLKRILGIRAEELFRVLWRPFFSALVMLGAVRVIIRFFGSEQHDGLYLLPRLLGSSVFGAIVYFACLLSLWVLASKPAGAESRVLALFREKVVSRMGPAIKAWNWRA